MSPAVLPAEYAVQCSVPCGSADIADSCPAAASGYGVKAVYTACLTASDALPVPVERPAVCTVELPVPVPVPVPAAVPVLVPVEPAAAASAVAAVHMFCSAGSSEPADLQYAAALH